MRVSCSWAKTLVAQQALTGIKLKTEFAQARQREARELCHLHRRRPVLGHPDRQLRRRAVRLADGQCDFVAMAVVPRDHDRAPLARALEGRLTEHHPFVLALHLRRMSAIEADLAALDARIEAQMEPFRAQRALLSSSETSIPA